MNRAQRGERARVLDRLEQAIEALKVFASIAGDEDPELHRLTLEALADMMKLRKRVDEAFATLKNP